MDEAKNREMDEQRKLAVQLFNETWSYLDLEERTKADDDRMLSASFASRYHWEKVGTKLNVARGEWQISRVFAVLKRPEGALYHAKRCIELSNEVGSECADYDLPFAYEAAARACDLTGDNDGYEKYLALATQAGEQIEKQDDRDYFFSELNSIRP